MPKTQRQDIQALRAVAVGAVVLYHLFPTRLTGGFVGVDVFFVISGYLITSQLSRELISTNRISLPQFWARRIRRLLPAAFTVLAACLVTLVAAMPRVTWQDNFTQVGASAVYLQNWVLGHDAVDYLRSESSPSLTQHYWSLSVEEQFYVCWPLLLGLAVLVARRLGRLSIATAIALALGTVAVGSFAVSVLMTSSNPPLAFFATQTRAWEFAAGALLTQVPATWAAGLRPALAWVGLGVVVVSCFWLSASHAFPGAIAAVPVLGAALFLAGDDRTAGPLVSHPVVQWLGDHSYGIYLWHWPPIVAAPWLLGHSARWPHKVAILLGTLVLAKLTKRFVEDPIRTGPRWRARVTPAYGFAAVGGAALLLVAFVGNTQVGDANRELARVTLARAEAGLPCYGAPAMTSPSCARPYARPSDLDTAFAAKDVFEPAHRCQQQRTERTAKLCAFGDTKHPRHTMAVVGNSHAVHFIAGLDLYGRQHGWKVVLAAETDCLGAITVPLGTVDASSACHAWSVSVQQQLLAMPHLDAVLFTSHVTSDLFLVGPQPSAADLASARRSVVETWIALRRAGIKVMVVQDVPGTRPEADPACIAASSAAYDPCPRQRSVVVRPNFLTTLAQAHPELVAYEDLTRHFCDTTTCHGLIGGVVVYSDSHHVSATYSRTLGGFLGDDVASMLSGQRQQGAMMR